MTGFANQEVARVFENYPETVRPSLFELRELIFDTANSIPGVGELEETLKWGQPSYLPRKSGIGSTIRIDAVSDPTDGYGLFFHCQTTLVESFRAKFADELRYEGNRALLFSTSQALPVEIVKQCISEALTYHLNKRKKSPRMRKVI